MGIGALDQPSGTLEELGLRRASAAAIEQLNLNIAGIAVAADRGC